ncbi:Protein RALF-like 29 [Arabidopsis thaliana]|uniref:Protein RALF-like 29 n=3 Tax=Arabidopsis TaxID=3701 RepID=RLF29_ARATH|nr:RALF-like 29 [Arabidopsis thaliana]A8MQP2.1 RecName: Full=Protein RALF-like 29; Flags: Precursor [Arabidopsis thaliana]KAG7615617.1 Rapid ALkalinization Factor [Arabidopsis thaliana x Arabidopsis arenosa]AEE83034.1 RALF-like 29 [Arabidopsis thaliana]CAA0394759.1 unnamed protein product [Arabidopsis thaliana]VYS62337.1 unnamed protein product [Arabidopsis thaliana]|eukprot:NP_001078374.1 RALF-like 29 [Arabidopsis thaliana]
MIKTKEVTFVTILIVLCVFISTIHAKRYIEYPIRLDLGKGCDPRFPTAACYKRTPANPYRRPCTTANRCRRSTSSTRVPSLKTFVEIPPM